MNIRHNISALNTMRQLGMVNKGVFKNTEKLSTSLRINRAGDDAAGLSISEKMRAQISGLDRANKNAQDGISLIQTAEGALAEVHSMLNRGRELAVQAANDTNTADDRQQLQKELEQLFEEVDRIGRDTEFNTMKLFDGTTNNLQIHFGANESQTTSIVLEEVSTTNLQLATVDIKTQANSEAVITALDNATEKISAQRSRLSAQQNRLGHTVNNNLITSDNTSSANSIIQDANMVFEMMGLTKNQILRDTMQSALSQGNQKGSEVLNLLK